jgi:hypothetical protein
MTTTVYRITCPSAYRRSVLNTQTGKVVRFTTDGGEDNYDLVLRGARAMGDDLAGVALTYGGNLADRYGRSTASFYVAAQA